MAYASSAVRTCSAARSHSENTATDRSPISRQARAMRTAISPRFAIRIFFTRGSYFRSEEGASPCDISEGDVAVFLGGILIAFVLQVPKGGNELGAGGAG